MIKLLIFDIDGVIVKSKVLHEIAFIQALNNHGIAITRQYHKDNLDGLPTKIKLDKLLVPEEIRTSIFNEKQVLTFKLAPDYIVKEDGIKSIFKNFHDDSYKIVIASNSIKQFCELIIDILEIRNYVDLVISNEDVKKSKPDPEMYNKSIEYFKINANEAVIFEDSKFGLKAAFGSGANVYHIQDPSYLQENKIRQFIEVYR